MKYILLAILWLIGLLILVFAYPIGVLWTFKINPIVNDMIAYDIATHVERGMTYDRRRSPKTYSEAFKMLFSIAKWKVISWGGIVQLKRGSLWYKGKEFCGW